MSDNSNKANINAFEKFKSSSKKELKNEIIRKKTFDKPLVIRLSRDVFSYLDPLFSVSYKKCSW